MNDRFLQSLLRTGLFDIGDSDERLKWLQQSIEDLQKKLEEDYSLLPKYTLVALDPNISDTEPILNDTESIVTTYWKALRGKFPEMPRNILRGVILNSLNNVGVADPIAARIIYLTALNFFPYAKLNNEKGLVEAMLTELGEIAEKNAVEEWSLIEEEPSLKLGTLKVGGLKFGTVKIEESALKQSLITAAKPTTQGYNQYNYPDQWSQHFAENAGNGIVEIIKEGFSAFRKSLDPASPRNFN